MDSPSPAGPCDTRLRILQALRAQPGCTVAQLARAVGVDHSTASYHLDRLESAAQAVTVRHAGRRHCFVAEGGGRRERALAIAQRRGLGALVLTNLTREPRALGAIAAGLPMSKAGVHWHLRRLVALGLVEAEPSPRGGRYRLAPGLQQAAPAFTQAEAPCAALQ